MCCAPQQANHLDSEDEDPFERIEDVFDIVDSDLELTEEEETIRILERELARVRAENKENIYERKISCFVAIFVIIGAFVIMPFYPLLSCHSRAPVAECPTIPECPPVPQCADSKNEEPRLCPGEQRVRVAMQSKDDDQRGFQVKDRVVTEIEEWTISKPPVLKVGHEIVFVDGVNVEEKTDEEIRSLIWTNSDAFIQTDIVVLNTTKFDYVKEICFMMELGTVLCLIFCFIINVLEPAVWARDKKAIDDAKRNSDSKTDTESQKVEDQQEIAPEDIINAQKVAIEDNRVELEMYEARLAAIKIEFEILEKRLEALAEKTAKVDEVEQASLNELDKLEKSLNECFPRSSEDEEEPKAGVITRSHKRLSRSNGMFLDAPSLLA